MNKPVIDQKLREKIVAARRAHLSSFGVEAPSGTTPKDLLRDLKDGRRIAVERGINALNRAKGDPADRLIEFVCSTEGPKRDGNVVRAAGFKFNNFDKNPVAPWGHDYSELPCGRWVERAVERVNGVPALVMTACFATEDINPRAEQVYRAYLGGFLNAVSIGWEPIKYRELRGPKGEWLGGIEFLESDLLECSFVLVPADPDAIPRAVRSGVFTADEAASFARWAEIDRGAAYVLSHRDDDGTATAALASAQARALDQEPAAATPPAGEPSASEPAPAADPGTQTAAAPDPQTRAEKECPDCGASNSGDSEACGRCGYDFKAGKKKDTSEKAGAPTAQLRRLTRKAQKRSELTDALDAEYDEVRALAYRFWEHVDRMGWDVDSMFYADKPAAEPYEASWAMECRAFIERTRKRCSALATSMDEALGRMGDAIGSIPLAAGAGDGTSAGPVLSAAGDVEHARAGKKQFSTSRLERLLAVEAGIAESRDLTEKHRALLREVLDEAVAEQREKEAAGADNPAATPNDPKGVQDVEPEQASAPDPLVAELEGLMRGEGKPFGKDDDDKEKKKGKDCEAAAPLPATRAADDPLLAEMESMLAASSGVRDAKVARTADGILAGLPGRE